MGTPMAHVSKSMLGRQANSHLKSSPSFGFGTEERAKASSAKSGGLTASPGPVYYPLSTTYNSYPKSPSHSFGAAHRYTKVNSAASSHRTARTGRGDTVPQACSHESAALGAPQLATLASLGGLPRPNLLSTPFGEATEPLHHDLCLAAASTGVSGSLWAVGRTPPLRPHADADRQTNTHVFPLTSPQLAAEWGGHTLRALQAPVPTTHHPRPFRPVPHPRPCNQLRGLPLDYAEVARC